jgi:DNA-directed RNA polymerase III subunit RPC11
MLSLMNDDSGGAGPSRMVLWCRVCQFKCPVLRAFSVAQPLGQRSRVDDVMGGDDAWQNVDQTEQKCPKCEHDRAYFTQMQLRSADEPMSIFYKCVKCAHRWREG